MIEVVTKTVLQWQREGALLVEDGNHGENRPRKEEFADEGMAFIRAADMADGMVLFEQAEKINAVAQRRVRKGIGRPGDIVISHKGTIGRVARVPMAAPDFVCSPQTTFWRVMDEEKIDRDFLFALLRSASFQELFATRAGETDMAGYVSLTSQRELALSLPSISIQREVGRTIRLIDDKIELNRKTASTLEEMARALYRSWFVDFDPVRARTDGRVPAHMDAATAALFPDSFGEDGLPMGWEISTIGDVAEIVGGSTPSTKQEEFWTDAEHAWATPKDLSNLGQAFLFDTERKVTSAGLAKISSGLSPAGTLLLSSRAPIGYLALTAVPVAVNQGFIAIRETARISGVEAYFWCVENMDLIHANSNGSTFQEISKTNFRPLAYALASPAVRGAYVKQAGLWFARMKELMDENRTLASLRDSLLPRLMSGELRLSSAYELIEEVA